MSVKITHVGQQVWYVPNSRNSSELILTVSLIGRKWAHLSPNGGKADLQTGEVDGAGYSSPGRVYNSEADYKNHLEHQTATQRLSNRINHYALRKVSKENIIAAAALLGISLEAE